MYTPHETLNRKFGIMRLYESVSESSEEIFKINLQVGANHRLRMLSKWGTIDLIS